MEFLGMCHAPNSVRRGKLTDRIQVWIGDTNYNYSIDSDKEEIEKHCLQTHFENSKETISEDEIYSVREQLELEFIQVEDVPGSTEVIAEKQPVKKAAKKKSAKKKVVKKSK